MKARDVEAALLEEVARILNEPVKDLDPARSLSELGLDSVGYCAVSAFISKRFGVEVRPESLFEFCSLEGTAAHVAGTSLEPGSEPLQAPRLPFAGPASNHGCRERDIAIVGLALKLPGANDPEQYWELIGRGDSMIRGFPAERQPTSNADPPADFLKAGIVDDVAAFDAAFFGISPREARTMDPQQRLFLECAWHAFEDAGYSTARLSGSNTSVYVGASSFDYYELLLRSPTAHTTHIGTGMSHAVIANRVSQFFNLKGSSEAIDTACSSSLVALCRAIEGLRRNESDLSLVGGVSVLASRTPFRVFADAGMLSPEGVCRPFDARAAGYVRGEGVACLLLKRAADALRDGDRIWGLIKGGAVRHSGRTNSLTAPNPDAQADVIVAAVKDADVDPLSIGYVEGHGTGTPLGDPIEVNGLKRAFQHLHAEYGRSQAPRHLFLGSVKAQIGHLEAAAGLAGLIKAVLALHHRILPGSPYLASVNPQIELRDACFGIAKEGNPWTRSAVESEPRRASVSSFGFGGVNAHVVLEEAPLAGARRAPPVGPQLLVLSAKTAEALAARASALGTQLDSLALSEHDAQRYFGDLAFSLRQATPLPHRLAIVSESLPALRAQLSRWQLGGSNLFSGVCRPAQPAPVGLSAPDRELEQPIAAGDALARLAALWVQGVAIDWPQVLPRTAERYVSVPSYPFAREPFWVGSELSTSAVAGVPASPRWGLYAPVWVPRPIGEDAEPGVEGVLLTLVSGPLGLRLAELVGQERRLLVVEPLTAESVVASAGTISGLLDLSAIDGLEEQHSLASRMRVEFVRRLIGPALKRGERLDVMQVTLGLQRFEGETGTRTLAGAQELGCYRGLWAEYRRCRSKTVDFSRASFTLESASTAIVRELRVHDGPSELGYVGDQRWARAMQALSTRPPEPDSETFGVALVTGGTGEIGLALAEDLVARGFRALLLTGRRELTSERKQRLEKLTSQGAAIALFRGNLCDEAELGESITRFRGAHGAITHVFHCAGAVDTRAPAFFQKTAESMAQVAQPKVDALWTLHRLFASAPPRAFVLFSSISAAAPRLTAGLLDYAAANRFLDLFAEHQHERGHRYYRSLQWTRWDKLGLSRATGHEASAGTALDADQCFDALHRVVAASELGPVVCITALHDPALAAEALERPTVLEAHHATSRSDDEQEAPSSMLRELRAMVAKELELPESRLDDRATFEDLGLDSIVLIGVVTRLEAWLGIKIDPNELIRGNSLAAVARHLAGLGVPTPSTADSSPAVGGSLLESPTGKLPSPGLSAPFRVAVIGIACRFPGAPDKESFWQNLVSGKDSVTTIPASRWNSAALYAGRHEPGKTVSCWGGFIEGMERVNPALFGLRPEDAADLDPLIRLFTEASLSVVLDSPYERASLAGRRVGVFAGARGSRYAERIAAPGKHSVTGVGQNFIAAFVSHLLDLRGPSLVLDSACSSSLAAVHLACQSLQSGDSELAIAGGVDLLLDEKPYLFLSAAHALSPDGRCRTFDEKANGFVPGEGVGCVMLKALSEALADGDPIYAVIDGSAINNDGHTLGITTPGVEGQVDVIERALHKAAVASSSVSYIETHGTGTLIGDPIELRALALAFAKDPPSQCALGSVKTNVGHLLSAAGIASFVKVALALHHQTLPPTLHCDHINPRFDFERTPFLPVRESRHWQPELGVRRAGISAFGFGKTNVHLIMSERPPGAGRPPDLAAAPAAVAEADKIYSWHPPPPSPWSKAPGLLGLETLTFESIDEA